MKINKLKLLSQLILAFLLAASNFSWALAPVRKDAKDIVKTMSLEQKAQLVVGTGMYFPMPDSLKDKLPPMFGGVLDETTEYGKMVAKVRGYLPGTAGVTAEFPELGITSQTLSDGPAGLRISPTRKGETQTYYATAFPIGTVMASTWDTELVEEVGKAMGQELLEYGATVILGPGMNIQRDPLCGRNFEYYSEDPLVTGKIAAAMVKGIQSNGVGTSVKHFAVNNQETNRMSANVVVSERALREIYLKGFEIAVKESKPWTVMSSYNKVNGIYTSESNDLLTRILRDDWGFEGYVMTDWGGGSDVVAQMQAGNDMIQPGSQQQIEEIIEAVKNGKLDEAVLDRNVERILNIMQKSPRNNGYKISNQPNLKGHAQVTRKAAADGMVLLENKNKVLPISANIKKIAAFGNTSYDFISGGTGSGDVNEAYSISLTQGLENAGFEVDLKLSETYISYMKTAKANQEKPANMLAAMMGGKIPVEEMKLDAELAAEMAQKNEFAIITIGRNAGEGGDREAVEGDFYLNSTERNLIQTVTDAFHKVGKKAVVILNIAGVIETGSWRNIPDAVLCAWQPGQEGGNSVVDVITGKVNPSGKLAVSFPVSYNDTPTAKNFPGSAIKQEGDADNAPDLSGFSFMQRVPWEVVYEEDIFVGYRYYKTFNVPVAYEFGYGLSYTTFDYSNLKLNTNKFEGKINVSIEVKNSGTVAGREVVQVYINAPDGKLQKPEQTLAAFGKTTLLKPGESENLQFEIESKDIASFNETNSSWLVEAGNYKVKVGASSNKIKKEAEFNITKDIIAGTVTKAMVPQRDFNRLSK